MVPKGKRNQPNPKSPSTEHTQVRKKRKSFQGKPKMKRKGQESAQEVKIEAQESINAEKKGPKGKGIDTRRETEGEEETGIETEIEIEREIEREAESGVEREKDQETAKAGKETETGRGTRGGISGRGGRGGIVEDMIEIDRSEIEVIVTGLDSPGKDHLRKESALHPLLPILIVKKFYPLTLCTLFPRPNSPLKYTTIERGQFWFSSLLPI